MRPEGPTPQQLVAARQRLAQARSRGAVKALGEAAEGDPALREALVYLARQAGHAPAPAWTGKRIVRAARAREHASRVRQNPIHRDEAFRCSSCGADVPVGGARVRDHCPGCLCSLHVDRVPGDRAEGCGGVLEPVWLDRKGADVVIGHRCRRCGAERQVRAHPSDRIPPSLDTADIAALSCAAGSVGPGPGPRS